MSEHEPITIDGSQGEGGGQIVRTSLALSCITGRPLSMIKVRAGRPKPGLGHQHLTSIRAAQRICSAQVTGASLGSKQFTFEPGPVQAGAYEFDVGTAGSTTLVLQTIALPLALSSGDSHVTITGGTHNPMAPCYEYLETVWVPLCKQLNLHVSLSLTRAGFYPVGGGKITAEIRGIGSPGALTACRFAERGEVLSIDGFSAVARLPRSIAERQARQAAERLDASGTAHDPITLRTLGASSPGTVLFLHCRSAYGTAGFFGLGARGKPAEQVADEAVDQLQDYLGRDGALDPHAADQLILPLALAPGASCFTTTRVTDHLVTHIEVLRQFLDRRIELTGSPNEYGRVNIDAILLDESADRSEVDRR